MSFDLPVPTNWKLTKLSDLGKVNRGRSRHRPRDAEHLYGGIYPFVQTGDVKASGGRIFNYTQTYSEAGLAQSRLWPKGTMCITIAANIAETGILQFPACFPDSIIGFIADESKCNIYFVEYMFRLLRRKIQAQATGSVQDNINLQTLERLLFPIPDLCTQDKVAKILGDLDNKITLNRQINQTLEAMAQALFKSWFVDFEPVKAKLSALAVGGSADDANLAAMSAISGKTTEQLLTLKTTHPDQFQQLVTTADLFPSEMVECELGEIPKGWEVIGFEKIAQPKKGKNITKSTVFEGCVPVVAGGLEPAYYHNTPNVFSPVITISASGANAGYVNLYHNDIWASDCSYISKNQTSYVYSVYCFLKLKQKEIYDMQQGAAQPHVYPKDLHRLKLASPESLALWLKLEKLIMPFFSMIKSHIQETHSLTQSRDTLLPKLLAGELLVDGVSDE